MSLGVGAVLLERLVVGDDLTPAVAAIDDVVNRADWQAGGVCYLGALVADVGEGLGLRCLRNRRAFASWRVKSSFLVAESLFVFAACQGRNH